MGQAGGLQSQYFVVVVFLGFFSLLSLEIVYLGDLISPLSLYFLLFIIIELSAKLQSLVLEPMSSYLCIF